MRLADLACQFAELPIDHNSVSDVAIESLKGAANSPMLNAISGVFIQFLPNATLRVKSFITPSAWKKVIRDRTGEAKPKGLTSLKLYDPTVPDMSEDEADSVMIGLTYLCKML